VAIQDLQVRIEQIPGLLLEKLKTKMTVVLILPLLLQLTLMIHQEIPTLVLSEIMTETGMTEAENNEIGTLY
jgi:hypothetical protein